MEERVAIQGFAPVAGARATALILGSYPSPKSMEEGFYYGHPRNRFWPLLAALSGRPLPQTVAQKRQLILDCGLALWDVLESCRILGAQDTSIKNPVPANVGGLLAKTGAKAVFCNGAAACHFYKQFWQSKTGFVAQCLPSTSPANAAYSLERLKTAWQPLASYLL